MQCKSYNDLPYLVQWDENKQQFFKSGGYVGLRMYEGGYLTFDANPDRDTGRTNWLSKYNCRVGTVDELPDDIVRNLCTPDGRPMVKADLTWHENPVLLCDLDHRMAVALDGHWARRRRKNAPRVYWPAASARPISNWALLVARANRKTAAEMRARRDAAADLLLVSMQMREIKKMSVGFTSWADVAEQVCRGAITPEWALEQYGNHPNVAGLESTLRNIKKYITDHSRDTVQVEYLKF